ncbi:MAG: PD-(D/E)XK nuclease family protein [Pseudarcicella sp.]|nr:PD-(D/E)XK nuclease family protein [Pseudarcicella sp.]MBP6410267.1 PD-(D/E)XK nuclease family protein [Pseudarcicella sp.]
MKTFLEDVASYIYNKHSKTELSRLCIILPSRRSVQYLKKNLSELSETPLLCPEIVAIDDFVISRSASVLIDPVSLLFELYEIFKEIDNSLDFDQFVAWAPTLLSDFDKIDQYLVSPHAIFSYLSAAKSIERWELEMGESARKKYQPSDVSFKHFNFFENLEAVYQQLNQQLKAKNKGYRGMLYRDLAEHIEEKLALSSLIQKYYIVGFNALSTSEETIFKYCTQNPSKGEMLWDSDKYYMQRPDQKAGKWLRNYKQNQVFGKWNWEYDCLQNTTKNIKTIAVTNASMQAKVLAEILSKEAQQESDLGQTAVVLADEDFLNQTVNSLPHNIANYNITMGVSMKQTLFYSFLDAWFDLQINTFAATLQDGNILKKYTNNHLQKVTNHVFLKPYLQKYFLEIENPFAAIDRKISTNQQLYFSAEELLNISSLDPLYLLIFKEWNAIESDCVTSLFGLIEILTSTENIALLPSKEQVFVMQFYEIVQKLNIVLKENNFAEKLTIQSFKKMLMDLLAQVVVPFEGVSDQHLQIMGTLETRVLDFEKIYLLSANETKLPSGKKLNSLIPYDAFVQYGLPTYEHTDAISAYHFFRLLQRAKEVVFVYVADPDAYGNGEKSRFILQLIHELLPLANQQEKNIHYTEEKAIFAINHPADKINLPTDFSIFKSPAIVEAIKNTLSQKGIYSSGLDDYLACSMKYYLKKIAKLPQKLEINQNIETNTFGNWMHEVLEKVFAKMSAGNILVEKQTLELALESIDSIIENSFDNLFKGQQKETGINHLNYTIGKTYIHDFLKFTIQNEQFPLQIIALEEEISHDLEFNISEENISAKVAGKIDRIDIAGERQLRVIDYKTGKVEMSDLKLNTKLDITENLKHPQKTKLRQLWWYKYLIYKKYITSNPSQLQNVVTGIYSFRNMDEGLFATDIVFEEGETPMSFIEQSENIIAQIIEEMISPAKYFERTTDINQCKYCSFTTICNRVVKENNF